MLSYFYRILERDGQTDGQNCCINIARQHTIAFLGNSRKKLFVWGMLTLD